MEKFLGKVPVLNRRFAVVQGSKVRPIDDFSESAVNMCFSPNERIDLHDVDVVVAFLRLLDEVCAGMLGELVLSCGSVVNLHVHPDWKSCPQLLGKSMDLSAAYKQLAIHPTSFWTSGGICYDPSTDGCMYFIQRSLPFGASASVHAFNRCSRSLWAVGCRLAILPWTVFFDDFLIFAPAPIAKAARAVASIIALATGWSVAEGDKDLAFGSCLDALGVRFQLGRLGLRSFTVTNKPDRLPALEPVPLGGSFNSWSCRRLGVLAAVIGLNWTRR